MSAKYNRHDFNIIQGAIDFLDTAGSDATLSDVARGLEISPHKLMVTQKIGRAQCRMISRNI